jgi:hypothetical protein
LAVVDGSASSRPLWPLRGWRLFRTEEMVGPAYGCGVSDLAAAAFHACYAVMDPFAGS